MKRCFLFTLLVISFAGCATHKAPSQTLPTGNRVIWVKDFEPIISVKVNRAQKVSISDKIALLLDSRFSHKFSAIYRYPPQNPGTSIVVTGTIIDFGPGSSPAGDQGSLGTWMQQFGAGRLALEVTVTDAATGEKLINKAEIVYPIFEDVDFFGWTRIEQTINIAVENIVRKIGRLKIKNL